MLRLLVTAVGLVALTSPTSSSVHRRADLEFSLRPGLTAEMRREIALELWESGVVDRVEAPRGESRLYRVYLDDPTNLLHMQDVHVRLGDLCGVLSVTSLAGWVMPKDRHHPGCPLLFDRG